MRSIPRTRCAGFLRAVAMVSLLAIVALVIGFAMHVRYTPRPITTNVPESTVIIAEDWQGLLDVSPPDILSVHMDGQGDDQQECADMGGQFHPQPRICWHVDY